MGAPGGARVDADFVAAILARGNAYADQSGPEWTAALVAWLASPACDVTGQCYSVLSGNFARVFIGRSAGWAAPRGLCPSSEELAAALPNIASVETFGEPSSGIDEGDRVLAVLDKTYGAPAQGPRLA